MRQFVRWVLAVMAVVGVLPLVAAAHFQLLAPASWIIENDRGDPQKSGPCGGSNTDWGKPSNMIGQAVGGAMLHIKVRETVYHPGHYRVALAVNSPSELPLDPVATTRDTEKGPISVSAVIQAPPQIPVIADGLWVHSTRPAGPMDPFEGDVQLPNISCKKCTLQVVQFMEEHGVNNPGGFTYHHCANLQITADRTKPIDSGWPAER
jgi:hypothetical protein